MKAVFCEKLGTPDDLVVREIDPPGPPGPTELKVWLKARGVAFTDVLMVAGEYQVKPQLPFVVGGEGAGVVTEVGANVRGFSVGDRVLCPGGCVEQVLVDQSRITRLPDNVAFEPAAAFRANYATGLYGLQRARLKKGETLLVHGAAGGVGLAAVDLGKHLGAVVIATASTGQKRKVALEMGADHTIDYTGGFRDQVRALTDGRGADVIYDPVGGNVFDESMRCIAPFGRILIVGFTSGRPALAKTNHLLIKDAELIGFTIGALSRHDPEWAARNAEELMSLLAAGSIHPYISHQLPLEETAKALNLIRARRVIGKAIITSY